MIVLFWCEAYGGLLTYAGCWCGGYCIYGYWEYCGGVVCGGIVCCDLIWGNGGHWVLSCAGFWG
jgi:hypothetical protein